MSEGYGGDFDFDFDRGRGWLLLDVSRGARRRKAGEKDQEGGTEQGEESDPVTRPWDGDWKRRI